MSNFFRWPTVMKAWDYTKPFLLRMAGDMAADFADRARKAAR
ncbi:hypothetical protein ACIA8B_19545 [Micromonospora chalcea]